MCHKCLAFLMLVALAIAPLFELRAATILVEGKVRDKTKTPIVGATVIFEVPGEAPKKARTNRAGAYLMRNLAPGTYAIRVEARRFQPYEMLSYRVSGVQDVHLSFTLDLAPVRQEIVVSSGEKPLGVEPESSASTIGLRGAVLAGLPDDQSDFTAALEALAGPSALGPTYPQIFVNGFILAELPPKETIARFASIKIRFRLRTTGRQPIGLRQRQKPAVSRFMEKRT